MPVWKNMWKSKTLWRNFSDYGGTQIAAATVGSSSYLLLPWEERYTWEKMKGTEFFLQKLALFQAFYSERISLKLGLSDATHKVTRSSQCIVGNSSCIYTLKDLEACFLSPAMNGLLHKVPMILVGSVVIISGFTWSCCTPPTPCPPMFNWITSKENTSDLTRVEHSFGLRRVWCLRWRWGKGQALQTQISRAQILFSVTTMIKRFSP